MRICSRKISSAFAYYDFSEYLLLVLLMLYFKRYRPIAGSTLHVMPPAPMNGWIPIAFV